MTAPPAYTPRRYDAVIVGAGPAGSAAALALSRRGARVALVERCITPENRMGESLRGIASVALRELGVWEEFQRLEQRPSYLHRAAWGGHVEERQAIRLQFGPDLHLDRADFDALLQNAAVARGATLFRPASVRNASATGGAARVVVAVGRETIELTARWLIDATGRGATLARRFGARRQDADRLIGVARSFVRGAREPSTLVEAADEGWWYSAPQPGGRMVALFVTDGDSPARQARRDDTWARCLQSAPLTRQRLDAAVALGPARAYLATPAALHFHLEQPVLPVGDAALSFDPIAADGLCFALRSGLDAAAALSGPSGATHAYRDGIRAIFHDHLRRRESIYASERHIRNTPFWRRPRAGALAAPGSGGMS